MSVLRPLPFVLLALASYLVGLFRSVRFGVEEAHGKGAALQINTYLDAGAATWNVGTKRLTVDFDVLEATIGKLLATILQVQFEGDRDAASALLDDRERITEPIKGVLSRLDDVPVDLRPIYPAAGER